MPRGISIWLLGAGLLLLAVGVGVGFVLGVTAQTIGVRTPLYFAIAVFLAVFVVGMLFTVYRFMDSYRQAIRALQDPQRGGLTSLSAQQGGLGSLAGAAELLGALREFEARISALQRVPEGDEAPGKESAADFATPPESVQNKDAV